MNNINETWIPMDTTTTANPPIDRGDGEKILAMAVLGLGSFLAGMIPAVISHRNRRRFPLTTSLLLCFGAGILLATALVHILPEVRQQMSSNFAEIALCSGFFIIYFIDEFIHYFFGEAIQHSHSPNISNNISEPTQPIQSNRNYGTLSSETEPLLNANNDNLENSIVSPNVTSTTSVIASCIATATIPHSHESSHAQHLNVPASASRRSSHCSDAEAIAEANARICHTSHTEPCAETMTGTLGLFVALSLHSAIEGLAIGVQNSATKVLFLLGAVACHKFVMGFCLGLEFRSNAQTNLRSQFIGILIFSLGAVCGIGIGMIIVDIPANWATTTLPVIQALAGGTLFYVTVCEVIPREKAHWHQNSRKAAGFAQFMAVFSGFAIMCVINYFLDDDDK